MIREERYDIDGMVDSCVEQEFCAHPSCTMKHPGALILLATGFSVQCLAVDRKVSPLPQTGAYTTITAALASCNDGDRIIVEPAVYDEDLLVDRSVQLLAGVQPIPGASAWVRVNGTVTLAPVTHTEIVIQGFRSAADGAFSVLSGSQPSGVRSSIVLDLCELVSVELTHSNWNVVIERSFAERVRYRIGTMTHTRAWSLRVDNEAAAGAVNRLVECSINTTSTGLSPSYYSNQAVPLHMEGCVLHASSLPGDEGLVVFPPPAGSSHVLLNNTFFYGSGTMGAMNTALLSYYGTEPSSLILLNNLFVYDVAQGPTFPAVLAAAPQAVQASYCMQSLGFATSAIPILSSGQTASQLYSNTLMTQPGSAAHDAGDPGVGYTDLDGTRNDIGCLGGPFPFTSTTIVEAGPAEVDLLIAPRKVQAGSSFTISVHGTDQ